MLVHKIVAITPIPTSTMGKFSVVRLTTWRVIFDIRLRTQGATKPIKHLVASTTRTALVNNNAYDAARRSLRNPIKCFDQAASTAAFRFLRHPSRPNAPRPVANGDVRSYNSGHVHLAMLRTCALLTHLERAPLSAWDRVHRSR